MQRHIILNHHSFLSFHVKRNLLFETLEKFILRCSYCPTHLNIRLYRLTICLMSVNEINVFSALLLLKIKMVSVTTQAVLASTYTMEDGYDKNERPSEYTY